MTVCLWLISFSENFQGWEANAKAMRKHHKKDDSSQLKVINHVSEMFGNSDSHLTQTFS